MTLDLGAALRQASASPPTAVPAIVAGAAAAIGAVDVVLYLVDFGQTVLAPLPDLAAHAALPGSEHVGTTMAGRAFLDRRVVSAVNEHGVRVWAPVLEGSDRTGVLALTLPDLDEQLERACGELGLLAGCLIAAQARCTDTYNLHRRRTTMSLAASMQWDLLPPLVLRAGHVSVAGLVEPAYEVGGDSFDYAANGATLDLAIFDAMGHGIGAAVISAVAVGAYRRDRREARPLGAIHKNLGTTITEHTQRPAFVTGILAQLDCVAGELSWTNAGHCVPLLVREGRVVRQLEHDPTPPWGTVPEPPEVAVERLQPGDAVLFYTDGVIEARTPDGEQFGLERLVDHVQRSATDMAQPEDTVRRVVASVLEHQATALRDDATLVLLRWDGPPAG